MAKLDETPAPPPAVEGHVIPSGTLIDLAELQLEITMATTDDVNLGLTALEDGTQLLQVFDAAGQQYPAPASDVQVWVAAHTPPLEPETMESKLGKIDLTKVVDPAVKNALEEMRAALCLQTKTDTAK